MALLLHGPANAQTGTVLPTRGKTFWTGFMQNGFGAQSLKVHVMGAPSTSGTVSLPGTGWSAPFTVAGNGVVVVDVPTNAEHSGSETVQNKGVLIKAQDSVNVLISSFQNFTHDLAQVLPVSSLGDSYRVDSYQGLPNFNDLHKSELLIVATQDGTQVRITPTANTLGGRPAGVPFTVDLDEGQSYQMQAAQDHLDLTGTLVEATELSGPCRPFVVLGGAACATVPGSCSACDVVFEQIIPRSAWGTRYFTVPVQGVTASTYRIMADENGTSVTIGGGSPIALNAGQRHEVNGNTVPVCIQANKPISVVQLLEGFSCAGDGDPAMMLLSPVERMSRSATLHTPVSGQINHHGISVVVPPSAVGQLTLNGNVVSPALFQPYQGCADRMYARFPVPAGVHRLQATSGFQAYLFGLGHGESYAAGMHDIGAFSVPEDSIICSSGPVVLNTPEPLIDVEWVAASDPATVLGTGNSLLVAPTTSESYIVRGTVASSGCGRSFTYHVGVTLSIPTLLAANGGSTVSICRFESVQLGLDPPPDPAWFNVQWSPAASLDDPFSSTPVASPQEDTWYKAEVTSPSGCGAMVDSIFVEVVPAQVMEMKAFTERDELCAGESTELTSRTLRVIGQDRFEALGNPLWNAIQGGTPGQSCGSVSGNALYFNGNGQRFAQTIGLDTQGGGLIRFHLKIADGVAPCQNVDPGEDVVLEYSTNNGFSWVLMNVFQENAYPVFTLTDIVIPTGAQTGNTMFRLRQLANSGAGHDNWAIDDLLVARYDDGWLDYGWTSSAVADPTAPNTMAAPTQSGWFVLNGVDPVAGCSYADSVYVHVDPPFGLTLTNDTSICDIAGVRLKAVPSFSAPISYQWGPDDGSLSDTTDPSPTATPQETTTYTVEATTASGCKASGAVTVQVGQLLGLDLAASPTALCQGQSTQLQASATGASGLVYAWTGAGLSATDIAAPTATPQQTTTYAVTVSDPLSGCSLDDSVTVSVSTSYSADAGPDLVLCSTLGHTLGVQHDVPDASYSWAPAANLNAPDIRSPSILVDGPGTYMVTITDPNGCSVKDSLRIERPFHDLPTQQSVSACADMPPTLTAPLPGTSYLWSTGANTPSIVPGSSAPHTLTITDAGGCQGIITFNVTLFPLPTVELGPDVSLCGAVSHVLDADNPGNSVLWSTGSQDQQLAVTTSGAYTVVVTSPHGCSASDEVRVDLHELPVNVLEDRSACITDPPVLDAGNPGASYLWSTGEQGRSITATSSGVHAVMVTTPAGCSSTFEVDVTLFPELTVALGNDTSICEGSSLLLDAGPDPGSILWNTGAVTSTMEVDQAGTYGVTVSNGWCSAQASITVSLLQGPVNGLQDVTQCVDHPVTLDAGNPGSTYLWSNGDTAREILVIESGEHMVTVTTPDGCRGDLFANVTMVQPPSLDLGPDTVLCDGRLLRLDAGNPGSTYLWTTGPTGRYLDVHRSGIYGVTVNNGHCQRSDAISVFFNPSPVRMDRRQVFACLGETPYHVPVDAENPGSRYLWDAGDTTRVSMVNAYGWHHVDITNPYGCSIRDSVLVSEYCTSAIHVPNTFTPNGDGMNDVFIPVGTNIATMQLLIFDRWGTLLFESNDPTTGWDGTYRSSVVKNDMYMWRLSYRFFDDEMGTLSAEHELMGHIQVLR